jgi:oxygen-independent coproporphyrinogen-3 oxidase
MAFRGQAVTVPVSTLYFGGGTPTLLSIEELEKIMTYVKQVFDISALEECTIEANPEDLTTGYCQQLISLGFNRISIGIQSTNDLILQHLRRRHTAKEAIDAVYRAYEAGFSNISIDLIYGLWERSLHMWKDELTVASRLPITHISAYALTVEENTCLYRQLKKKQQPVVDEHQFVSEYYLLKEFIQKAGFFQYEISNFALPGYHSRHNSNYWQHIPYMGFGPSAHSFMKNTRTQNANTLDLYIKNAKNKCFTVESESLTEHDMYNEYIMLGLRTTRGVSIKKIREQFGTSLETHLINELYNIQNQYYTLNNEQLSLTTDGQLVSDYLIHRLFI